MIIFRPFTIEEEMSSRTHTEKQFSIDSILGKEVDVDILKSKIIPSKILIRLCHIFT